MPFSLDHLLQEAVRRGASDLLLVPGSPPVIRLHGELQALEGLSAIGHDDVTDMLTPFLAPPDAQRFRDGAAVDYCFELQGIGRFRCNLHRVRGGSAGSLRILPESSPEFASLNLPSQVMRLADMHKGFVLVVGPTGAGKSTTLACLLEIINEQRPVHIVTIEDPIEFRLKHRRAVVEQIQIGEDSPSFSAALRHALRQDPDVILLGDMRDQETIAIALTAAETGHLVFSTLHTNDTSQAIDRIIDVFPAHQQNQIRQQLSMSLTGVVAQHLIPMVQGTGRVPAVELLIATEAIRNLIRTGKTHQIYSSISTGRSVGMQTLDDSLADLIRRGLISRDAAFLRTVHREELEARLR
jgi:twitching motility protein PilT